MCLSSVFTTFVMAFKTVFLELGGQQKVLESKIKKVECLFPYGDISFGQELLNIQPTQSCYFSDMSKSLVIIFQTPFFFMPIWLVIIQSINDYNTHYHILTQLTLTLVLLAEGLPLLELPFITYRSSLNLLCHSETHVHDMMLYPYTC